MEKLENILASDPLKKIQPFLLTTPIGSKKKPSRSTLDIPPAKLQPTQFQLMVEAWELLPNPSSTLLVPLTSTKKVPVPVIPSENLFSSATSSSSSHNINATAPIRLIRATKWFRRVRVRQNNSGALKSLLERFEVQGCFLSPRQEKTWA